MANFDAILALTQKTYKFIEAKLLSDANAFEGTKYRRSGCYALDWILANHNPGGGLPRGKIIEFYGPEGCLEANTHIQYLSTCAYTGKAQNHKGGSIENLYQLFHGYKKPRDGAKKSIYYVNSINDDNCVFRQEILDVVHTGRKECYELVTEFGFKIQSTEDHKFFNGFEYVELRNLSAGDTVMVHANVHNSGKLPKEYYKEVNLRWYYKNQRLISGGVYYRERRHRLTYEAGMNELTLDEYISVLSFDENLPEGFWTIPDGFDVHHRDENKHNDAFDNLELIDSRNHARHHIDKLSFIAVEDSIKSIIKIGIRDTYDIKCAFPYNNYIANRFVVHNCGKTTLATICAASVNRYKERFMVLYLDFEHKWDFRYALSLGIVKDRVYFSQPSGPLSGVGGLELMINAIDADDIGLIIIDSMPAVMSKEEEEGDLTDANIGAAARLWGKALKKSANSSNANSPTIIVINQMRDNIGAMFGPKEKTAGGRALKHNATCRIDIRAREKQKDDKEDDDNVTGQNVQLKVVKNQTGENFQSTETQIIFGEGYDNSQWVLDKAIELGVITVLKKTKPREFQWDQLPGLNLMEQYFLNELDNSATLNKLYELCVKKKQKITAEEEAAALKERSLKEARKNSAPEVILAEAPDFS